MLLPNSHAWGTPQQSSPTLAGTFPSQEEETEVLMCPDQLLAGGLEYLSRLGIKTIGKINHLEKGALR